MNNENSSSDAVTVTSTTSTQDRHRARAPSAQDCEMLRIIIPQDPSETPDNTVERKRGGMMRRSISSGHWRDITRSFRKLLGGIGYLKERGRQARRWQRR